MIRVSRAMVFAAGLGKRMRPVTNSTPKPLIKVAGRPIIDWILDRCEAAGVAEAVVNTHYFAEKVDGFNSHPGGEIVHFSATQGNRFHHL